MPEMVWLGEDGTWFYPDPEREQGMFKPEITIFSSHRAPGQEMSNMKHVRYRRVRFGAAELVGKQIEHPWRSYA